MQHINGVDEALGAKIQNLIFTFDDLESIDVDPADPLVVRARWKRP